MGIVKQLIDQAEQRCKENGSRLTEKRKMVLSLLLKSDKALSAYELVGAYKTEFGDALPAMSVYRILKFLIDERLVHKLVLVNKYVACEHISCEHDHAESQFLICSQCQKVKEISVSKATMEALRKNVNNVGFHLASPQLEMKCICQDCLASAA